jgi:putative membrane protein
MSQNLQAINRRVRCGLVAFAGIAILSATSALTQMRPSSPSPSPTSPQQGTSPMDQANGNQDPNGTAALEDRAFVRKALQGGATEVQLGQLALQKSSNDDVKQFAQRMVDDHTKLGDEMKPIAQQMSIKGAESPSKKDKSEMAKLQALSGDDFDKAYIRDMVKDHQDDLKDFKQEAQNTTNPALKDVVVQGAQVIDEHLKMIQQIAQKNNVVASK